MDDFDEFLNSVPDTPSKAKNITVPTSSSDDALDDFFTEMDIAPKNSVVEAVAVPDQSSSDTIMNKQLEMQKLQSLENESIVRDKIILEQIPPSISTDISTKDQVLDDSVVASGNPPAVDLPPAAIKNDDDFDELFGDTTPVKKVDIAEGLTTTNLGEGRKEEPFSSTTSNLVGNLPALTPAKAADITDYEELFGTTTPMVLSSAVKLANSSEVMGIPDGVGLSEKMQTAVAATSSNPLAISVQSAKKESTDDDLDFLSWLGDNTTPIKTPSATPGPTPGSRPLPQVDILSSLSEKTFRRCSSSSADSGLTTPTHAQSKVKALMDNFFDDLFGGISRAAPIVGQDASLQVKISNADFEKQVGEMISSNFIDVPTLRSLLRQGEYIPRAHRGQVLCALLTGECSINEDPELEDSDGLSSLASKIDNYEEMISDCNSVTAEPYCDVPASSQVTQDLQDILTLYCIRKERKYSSLLCSVLAPLLLAPNSLSKEQSSSCFYSLVSDFFPLLNLQPPGIEAALYTVHSWLRLLVVYHSPAVAHHLDRTIPGWEKATSLSGIVPVGSAEAEVEDGTLADKENAGIPDMESNAKESGGTWRERGSTKPESWGIPLHWICGIFAGSLPVEYSSFLLDWALISQQRYAGVYLIAALIELYSGALMTMTGDDIRTWLQAVSTGQKDWYTLLPLCLPHPLSVVEFSLTSPVTDWSEFTCGWVHAATVLQLNTPAAYRQALNNTEQWVASRSSTAGTIPSRAPSMTTDSNPQTVRDSDIAALTAEYEAESEAMAISDDNMSPYPPPTSLSDSKGLVVGVKDDIVDGQGAAHGKGLLDRMKLLGTKMFTGTGPNQPSGPNSTDSHGHFKSVWAHESMLEADSMCLWSGPGEVVPFISSSSRTALPPSESIQYHFQAGVIAVSNSKIGESKENKIEGNGVSFDDVSGRMTFPPLLEYCCTNIQETLRGPAPGVIYFGIDCRNERERTLGLFPRAYCIDPSFMTDTDQISKLLVTLEPLASSLHFCIIGAGEDFFEATYQPQRQGKLQELDTLSSVVADDRARLNAVAMFFLKRSFPHVSILDGGFVGAVRHLRESEPSLSLSNALADANVSILEAVLNFNGGSVVNVPIPGVEVMSLAARFRQSVGEVNSNFQRAAISVGPIAASLIKVPPRISESLDDDKDDTEDDGLSLRLHTLAPPIAPGDEPVDGKAESDLPSLPPLNARSVAEAPSSVPAAAVATSATTAASYFGGFGKKMSAFGASSLETVRHNIAAAQLAHQQQQELIKQQQLQQPQQETPKQTGGVLWSSDIVAGPSSSSSSSKGTGEGGMGFMGGLRSAIVSKINTARGGAVDDKVNVNFPSQSSVRGSTFVIDEEDDGDEDDGMGPRDVDPHKICISKTDAERAQALAMHMLAGLKKGDTISITRESLPGALLFPGIKLKERKVELEAELAPATVSAEDTLDQIGQKEVDEDRGTESEKGSVDKAIFDTEMCDPEAVAPISSKVCTEGSTATSTSTSIAPSQSPVQVHRFLVVTRERFMVLDSGGSGIGSSAIVKSNHHLTELLKMTFRKSDPDLICLYLGPEGKMRQYRVSRRKEFVEALQKNMLRFK